MADSADVVFQRSSLVSWRIIDGEALLVLPGAGEVMALNETGTVLWEALDGAATLGDVVERHVCERFEVDFPTALADAEVLLDALVAAGSVERCPEDPPGGQRR